MNVALIAPSYDSHDIGVGRTVRELAHSVARAGGHVEVLTDTPAAMSPAPVDDGVTVRHVAPPNGSGYAATRALLSYLRHQGARYDLVHAHGYLTLPAVTAARGLFGRLVFSPHHFLVRGTRIPKLALGPNRQVGRTALASADLVICSSQAEAEAVGREVPSSVVPRLRVISGGVDAHAIARARPFSSERHVILSVGAPDGGRRAHRAMSALPDLGEGYEMVLAGCHSTRRRLQARAADLQVSERVRILDRVSDAVMHSWLRTAGVVLALGDSDTGGLILMEAACAGVPVIASDTPAHREAARLINDPAVRLISGQASPLLIADETVRAVETQVNPLTALAMPSLQDVANQTVSLYSALLDDRLHDDGTDVLGAQPRARLWGRTADVQPLRGPS